MAREIEARGVLFHHAENVRDLLVEHGRVSGVVTDRDTYTAGSVILAPGRVGAEWMGTIAGRHSIGLSQRGIEVGVRVEVHNEIMQDLCEVIYDPTFFIRTNRYDDQTRTFCTNFGGYVALENYQDFVCVNGHALMDRKSANTNFAFLSKVTSRPVEDNQAYAVHRQTGHSDRRRRPILQRYGDLRRGRAHVEPHPQQLHRADTHQRGCGDIAMALPERILTTWWGLERLNLVHPGRGQRRNPALAPGSSFRHPMEPTAPGNSVQACSVAGDGPAWPQHRFAAADRA